MIQNPPPPLLFPPASVFTFLHFSLWFPSVVSSASLRFLSESHFYINIPPGHFKSFAFFMCLLFSDCLFIPLCSVASSVSFTHHFPSSRPLSYLPLRLRSHPSLSLVPPLLLPVRCTNTVSTLYCVHSYLSICLWCQQTQLLIEEAAVWIPARLDVGAFEVTRLIHISDFLQSIWIQEMLSFLFVSINISTMCVI